MDVVQVKLGESGLKRIVVHVFFFIFLTQVARKPRYECFEIHINLGIGPKEPIWVKGYTFTWIAKKAQVRNSHLTPFR